ncbi:MAG: GGDEF domain-containing protein [Actinomycetota bacterium]
MLRLTSHIVRTSALRDRTEINAALVEAMQDLFQPSALTIYRCFASEKKTIAFNCAGLGPGGPYSRNAYLPQRRHCRPVGQDALLRRCWKEKSIVLDVLPNGANRLVFPVTQHEHLLYLIDITVPDDFPPDQRLLLMGLVEYFGNHIALLDYAETDTLTSLSNRKTFDKHLFDLLGQAAVDDRSAPDSAPARRHGEGSNAHHWLAVCDIDHFKSINDEHGHLIGDEVLVLLSQIMRESFRFDDQLFRFGGEEFVIVLQPASRSSAFEALERFRQTIESRVFSQIGHITVSIGFSQLLPQDTPSDVIDRADEALYYVKQNGRNQVASYEVLVETGLMQPKPIHKGEIELF